MGTRHVKASRGSRSWNSRGDNTEGWGGGTLRLWVEVAVSSGAKGAEHLVLRGEALSWFAVANAREEQDIFLPSLRVPVNSRAASAACDERPSTPSSFSSQRWS